jgi:peptidoglycan/xylan/chitin deacetylase (PgdA/CDA1 family)
MKQLAYRILYSLRIFRVISFLFCRNRITILMYHGFSESEQHDGLETCGSNHIFIEHFKQQVRFLKKNCNVVSLHEALEMLRSGRAIPRHTVVLTIDDGYQSVYSLAFPVLREYGIPATLFCVTDFIKNREFLWGDRIEFILNMAKEKSIVFSHAGETLTLPFSTLPEKWEAITVIKAAMKRGDPALIPASVKKMEEELKLSLDSTPDTPALYQPLDMTSIIAMNNSGLVSIGSHTVSHVILSRCSSVQMEKELAESRRFLETALGSPVDLFCYPNGKEGDFNEETGSMVKKSGYACALTTVDGMNTVKTSPYELRRYWVRSTLRTLPEFAFCLCGFLSFMARLKRTISGLLK